MNPPRAIVRLLLLSGTVACTEQEPPALGDAARPNPLDAAADSGPLLAGPLDASVDGAFREAGALAATTPDAETTPSDASVRCNGTWDTPEAYAQVICRDRDCRVCVQSVDPSGTPVAWVALEPGSRCACPTPTTIPARVMPGT